MKWHFFGGACLLTAVLLLSIGAPPVAVFCGMLIAGVLTWKKDYKNRLPAKEKRVSMAGRRPSDGDRPLR